MSSKSAQPAIEKGAELSRDRVYRYRLWRRWGHGEQMTFIGLNPSTADETVDDQTIRKCVGFAERHGCEGIEMLNLFALRERDPLRMKAHAEPIGRRNNEVLLQFAGAARHVVACWGVHGKHHGRDSTVIELMASHGIELRCFGLTKDGFPKHPLPLPYSTQLVTFG